MKADQTEAQDPVKRLLSIMRRLRSPEGCPWDRRQTLDTLKPCLLEEAHEVIEAIDNGDREALKEELGDLLLQVVFQAQVGDEEGWFDFNDVVRALAEKLVRRHPHVFGNSDAADAEQVLRQWDSIKSGEKGGNGSRLGSVPRSLPALQRAQSVQLRAARTGFDWDRVLPVIAKVEEELEELRNAMQENSPAEVEDEIGDLIFAVVNLSRFVDCRAEDSLHRATDKFVARFEAVERHFLEQDRELGDCTLEEMDAAWEKIKR